jgi:AraC family transcriptional regulator, regulatory protein of adaptative response / DNA-3-methyladenine glycosylase II
MPAEILRDPDACYRAVSSRDSRFDGRLYLGVRSTGVYCRPSCPARTPRPENCRYYPSAAAAVAAGFRACRRCRPDALPGSRDDDHRADLAARALRLIRDGEVDAAGVGGLAARLHVSERHLHRVLVGEVGVGPLRLAATRRAQTARLLVDQTPLTMAEVAFAAGFASIRQFNDAMRAEFGCPPSALRRRQPDAADRRPRGGVPGLTLRLRYREPYAVDPLWAFLTARLVPGVEALDGAGALTRPVPVGERTARVSVQPPRDGLVTARLDLADLADLGPVVGRLRRWLDLDADPAAVDAVLGADPGLAPLVAAWPGMRVPGAVDGFEIAVRAIVGQQVSVPGARTLLGRVVATLGTAGFPGAVEVAAAGPEPLRAAGLTGARAAAVHAVAAEVAAGRLVLDPGADRAEARQRLLAVRGVGPWTAEYVALRALADPDAWPAGDAVLAAQVRDRGLHPQRWRPWRGYAALHLWTAASRPKEQP